MKTIQILISALLISLVPLSAVAQFEGEELRPARDGYERTERDRGNRDRDRQFCTVKFKRCQIQIGPFCAKWTNASFEVREFRNRNACNIAYRRYGNIKNCRVNCR